MTSENASNLQLSCVNTVPHADGLHILRQKEAVQVHHPVLVRSSLTAAETSPTATGKH